MSLTVGTRVWFAGEKRPFDVQAVSASGRFVVCTRPFAARRTVLYCMLDTVQRLRGVDNSMGNSLGYETREDCESAVEQFERGKYTFSARRAPLPLDIIKTRKEQP
jgi:hypothetical protein